MNIKKSKPYRNVMSFVDWNSQIKIYSSEKEHDPTALARHTFKMVTRRISQCLAKVDEKRKFKVNIRLYHGWHKGYEPSTNKKAVIQAIAEADFSSLSQKPNIIFSEHVGFGDCLITALSTRLHDRLAIHLPNTLRDRGGRGIEEKMVDTALASDMIVSAFQEPEDWILVAAEDDDLVPPIFVVEAIMHDTDARVLLLSKRRRSGNFLNLTNILVEEK